jgi:hypothetical protein
MFLGGAEDPAVQLDLEKSTAQGWTDVLEIARMSSCGQISERDLMA